METGLYVALSGQIALQRTLDTLANNVANSDTYGFRAEKISFESLYSRLGSQPVTFSSTGEVFMSRKSGPVVRTDNPLDVAISGNAWMAFETPAGIVYTRDGRMKVTAAGELQSSMGYPFVDRGGAPLRVNPAGGSIIIGSDGMITQQGKRIGAIGLFELDETAKLSRFENSAVTSDVPGTLVTDFNSTSVQQGHLEKSNVNPILEIVHLVTINRQFEAVTSAIDRSDQSLKEAIRSLGGAR